jgi:hypothetical protein
MSKLFAFVVRRAELEPEAFWVGWDAELRELTETSAVRRCVVNRSIPDARVPGLGVSHFDGAIELWFEGGDGLAGDRAWRERLDAAIARLTAPNGAIVLAAEESVQFDRGFGAVKFIGLSRRAERFTTQKEWVRYWRDVHGPLAHGLADFTRYYGRYVHNYVLPDPLGTGAGELEFDGIVEEWLESVDAFAACLAEPAYLEHVRPDERHFVDFTRSHMLITTEHVIGDG